MKFRSMMQPRALAVVFAVVLGAFAWVAANRWVTEQRHQVDVLRKDVMANYQAPIDVVVAAKDLPEGTILEPSTLRLRTVPEKFVEPYAVRAPNALFGKVTVAPIAEGEQVLGNKVRRAEEIPKGATLSGVMPEGKRAVTINADAVTGVGGFVRPGDLVDILWGLQVPQPGQKEPQTITLTLFQGVPVLAVGRQMVGAAPGSPAAPSSSESGSAPTSAFMFTLALNPQETALLLFAREQGRIQLSLRSRADKDGKVAVAPANMGTLMESVLGQKPPPPPPPPRTVEVYRALDRSVVNVTESTNP